MPKYSIQNPMIARYVCVHTQPVTPESRAFLGTVQEWYPGWEIDQGEFIGEVAWMSLNRDIIGWVPTSDLEPVNA